VRRTLAATLREQGSIFGKEVEAFLAEEVRARSGHLEKEETIDWVDQGTADEDEPKVSPKERRIRKVAHRVLVVFVCCPCFASLVCWLIRWCRNGCRVWPRR
jgi:hypothetical protein